MTSCSVDILLATRNGGRHLDALLTSLQAQSFDDFTLFASDDQSSDDTVKILEAHAPRFSRSPTIMRRETPSGSARANFASLLTMSSGDYVLLADQDDVWLPEKVAAALTRLRALEAEHGASAPLLTHCDLIPVTDALRPLAPSYWRFKSIAPSYGAHLPTALMHASVTGCATAVNRALVERIDIIPQEAVMHDWWMNLVAAAFGAVDYDSTPRILYRIHDANSSKPQRVSLAAMLARKAKVFGVRDALSRRIAQARALEERFRDEMTLKDRRLVEAFARLPEANFVARRVALLRGGYFFPEWWRNLAALAMI